MEVKNEACLGDGSVNARVIGRGVEFANFGGDFEAVGVDKTVAHQNDVLRRKTLVLALYARHFGNDRAAR